MHKTKKAKNAWRDACRKKVSPVTLKKRRAKYTAIRNAKNCLVRFEKNMQQSDKLYDGIHNANSVWEILRKFLPDPHYNSPKRKMEIQGKTGTNLANHMANFFLERAFLVSDELAENFSEFILSSFESFMTILEVFRQG